MKKAMPLLEQMPRRLVDELLQLLHSDTFRKEDLPRSAAQYETVKRYSLQVVRMQTYDFQWTADGQV